MNKIFTIKASNIQKIAKNTEDTNIVIVMPYLHYELARKAAMSMKLRSHTDFFLFLIEDDLRIGFIKIANLVYLNTRSKYFGYVAQDAFPGEFWLKYALETLEETKSGLLAFNDGRFFGKIATFGLVLRSWVRTMYRNLLFYPEYISHFADTELSILAATSNALVFNPNAILIEVDYEKHLHGNNQADYEVYVRRAKSGFDGRIAPFTPCITQ